MSNEVVIDSNVWIYLYSGDNEKRAKAEGLIKNSDCEIYISTQILGEIYTVLVKKGFASAENARSFVNSLANFYPVLPVSNENVVEALKLIEEYSLNYWDALVVAVSLQKGVEILYSEDMQHNLNVRNTLKILNPFI